MRQAIQNKEPGDITMQTRAYPVHLSLTILSVSIAVITGTAWAQSTTDATVSTEGKQTGLETVVVTAQKRSQAVKDVPIAMTVVSAAQLERAGVKDIADLANTAASLEFGDQKTGGAGGSASIRGIGTSVFTTTAESSVGVVVDGVPQGATASGVILDLARVEVLRGPQGTLFGKNASAGVLNMATQSPVIGDTEGNATLEYKGRKGSAVRGTVNLSLNEISALRVSGVGENSNGVYHNTYTGKDSETNKGGLRARYLLKPNSDLTLNVIADASISRSTGAVFFAPMVAAVTNTAGDHRPLAEFAACGVTVSKTNNQVCSDSEELDRIVVRGLSGQVDWALGSEHTLTAITAVRQRNRGPNASAIDMSNSYDKIRSSNLTEKDHLVSQELRLASVTGLPFEYVAGFFYSNATHEGDSTSTILPSTALPSPPVPLSIVTLTDVNAGMITKAMFGQSTFRLSSDIKLIAGLRYTRDSVASDQTRTTDVAFSGLALPTTVKYSIGNARLSNFSGKLGLQYAPASNIITYATISRGYKAPQIDNSTLLGAGSTSGTYGTILVRPEVPTSVEVGAKMNLWQRKLDLDVALFHTKIKDFQEQNCTMSAIGALSCVPVNVPDVTSQGLELDLRARPIPALQLGASMAAIFDTSYPSGFTFDGVNVGGSRLLYSPEQKTVASADYTWQLPNDYALTFGGEVIYKSAVRYCNTLDANCTFGGHTISSLRFALRDADSKWNAKLYARNLADKRVPNAIMYPLPGKGSGSGYAYSLGENSFRTVGITLDWYF
jgi:iron complex outermembrane receptor protein